MTIDSLDDVQPGDIMIAGQSTAPAKLTVYGGELLLHESFTIGELKAGHAAVVVPGKKLVEAMPSGARIRDLQRSDWTPAQAFIRLPETYPGQALDAAAVAMAMIGTPYSLMSYAYLGTYLAGFQPEWLESRINRRHPPRPIRMPIAGDKLVALPVEEICSVLADQAWTLTGYKVVHGTAPQVVTPGMLGIQLWHRSGVIWGGAGLS
jgi:hypothetical protein